MSAVEREHLVRKAYVYVRQSTPAQVQSNTESLERQYELAERAVALGWGAGEVVVVDSDLGRSGASTRGRDGFQQLVADVGLGKVGIVLGIEVSRLARRNADWYQLLDLCALTDTLIADADGVYHPALHNDRLVLGLKGTMSEAELHVLRSRLRGGILHKAAKGELRLPLPAGYEHDDQGQVRITPDEAVADAIATVFAHFEQLSSARQVMLRLLEEGRRLPRRATGARQVRWARPTYKAIHEILTNPCYAGVYAFGRKRTERRVEAGVVIERQRRAAREQWLVCLQDHHPGYISWDAYLANQHRLRANWRPPRGEGGGAAREGRALLQGLIRCGRCGRMMQVGYTGPSLVPRYACSRGSQLYGGERCQSVGGRRIEQVVLDALFEALRPAAIEATLRAIEQTTEDHDARVRSAELELERARIGAERARRQFDACEPENRLVARTLEREWEQRLTEVRRAEHALAEVGARHPEPLTAEEIAWCRHAGTDLRQVFAAPTTSHRERKQLLRAIITEVVVTVDREQHRPPCGSPGRAARSPTTASPCRAPEATRAPPTRTRSRSSAASPSTTPTRRSPRSSPAKAASPATATRSPPPACTPCAPTTGSPPRLPSEPPLTMATWSPSPRPPARSACPPPPCTAGCARASSPASRSPPARPGRSASPPSCAPASASTRPTAGSRLPRQRRRSASLARPCCIESNAAGSPPSTSAAASAKAYESRSYPTTLDCSTTNPEGRHSATATSRCPGGAR
jgi:DNA invertase Pin-like site-specific DNA recombinase